MTIQIEKRWENAPLALAAADERDKTIAINRDSRRRSSISSTIQKVIEFLM